MPEIDEGAKLIYRKEVLDPIAQLLDYIAGVVCKCFNSVAVLPSALVLQCLWQFPMIQRRERRDANGEQLIYDPIIKIQTFCIRFTGPVRENARPRNREAVRIRAD